ncbi:DEAD/DEAH box helicase family protein [Vibrio splendidus]|uniref:DEAD/DEAH box helicase family protein n=1 Tax=Vibrio splendidus TaxID=29497 RepID=UPI000D3608B4|nr:DEAD/DEAH box helicase family protein [Vibrio splendidus]PTP52458.1 restriction endonuclease [Vibrio splendidus]
MIKNFKDIDKLSPNDFELFVCNLFLASGWSDARVTNVGKEFRHGDGGVDIFAYKGKRKFAIEVKQRHIETSVDVKSLNQLVTGAKLANVTHKILVTNSYFTSEVKVRALRLGVELIDRDELQNLWVKKHSEIGREIKPRKYQQDVIDDAISQYEAGKTKLLIEMATGLGKTYTVSHLVKRLIQNDYERPRVLFLAHQVEILLQSVTSFKNVLGVGNYSFSVCISGSKPEDTDFVFASFDTLYGQIDSLSAESFDYIVVDEAHHTPARTYGEVINRFTPKLLIGLTATPYRADNKDVLSFFGGEDGHIGRFDLVWALKHRKLAFPKYLVLLDDLDQGKIDQLESGLSVSNLDRELFLHKKDQEVVKIIENTVLEKEIEDVKGIIFCKSIQHMRHLLGFFELGTATLVHSKMTDQERRENIRNFREGDFKFILVCDLFNEGIDIPETNLLVFMRHTGSRTIWLQQLGRGLRKTPNKDYVHVLDFVGSLERLNEIKELASSIDKTPLDKDSLHDDDQPKERRTIYHDSTLEVKFSQEAAKVLTLLEQMKMQLNSREILIARIRALREETGQIPPIEELESALPGVSFDQIATHFGSYFSYLLAAFDQDINQQSMFNKLRIYFKDYSTQQKLAPSVRAIAHHFLHHQLLEFTEREIKIALPKIAELHVERNDNEKVDEVVIVEHEKCSLVERYKTKVKNRSDLSLISLKDQELIKRKYRSPSVFLKKLKGSV